MVFLLIMELTSPMIWHVVALHFLWGLQCSLHAQTKLHMCPSMSNELVQGCLRNTILRLKGFEYLHLGKLTK